MSHPFGGVRDDKYVLHIQLVGKRLIDFLFAINELFVSFYGWDVIRSRGGSGRHKAMDLPIIRDFFYKLSTLFNEFSDIFGVDYY